MKKLVSLPFVMSVLVFSPARAAEPTIARLGNGLDVVLIENHGSPMIAATMIVRAGADLETAATSGASHMMEHLLFNGTDRRTQKELYGETDLYGIYNNATTRRFHTDYFVLVSREHIRQAMDIQADMLFHSIFPEEKLEKERGIVLEEIGKDEQDPSYTADRLFRAIAFAGTPYARPILGTRSSIAAISRDELIRYHRVTYGPNNMLLLVMGDFDSDSLLPAIDAIYGDAEARAVPRHGSFLPPPIGRGERMRVFHGETEKGFLFLALDAPPKSAAGSVPFAVAARFLDGRLGIDLTEGNAPVAFSAGASYERREAWGRLVLSATFDPEKAPERVEAAILAGVTRWMQHAPAEDEVDRFRISAKTGEIYLAEKPHMYGLMKAEAYARGGYAAVEAYLSALDLLDGARLRDAAGEALDTERRFSVAFLPGEIDYGERDLAVAAGGERSAWAGEENAPPPGETIVLRRVEPEARRAGEGGSGRLDTTFANGLRLLVDSNDDSPVFAIHLLAKHRSWQEPEGKGGIADLLHRLLVRGAGALDARGQKAAFERIGAEIKVCDASYIPYDDYYTVPDYSYVRFTTIDEEAARGIDLFADMILRPRLAAEAVEALKSEMIVLARGRASKPSTRSLALFRKALYGDRPLAADPEGTAESIASLTREDVARFRDLYFAPDNLILSVVTSLPAAGVVKRIAERFAPAAPLTRRKPPPPPPAMTTSESRVEETLGGSQSYLRIGYVVPVADEDRAPLRVAVSILSDEIAFDLRESRGLAYTVGAGVSFHGDAAVVSTVIGTSPENLEEAEAGIREHLDRWGTIGPIDEKKIERAVNALAGRMNMRRLSRANQAYRAGLAAFSGGGDDWIAELPAVTGGDAGRAAHRYLRSAPAVTVLVR